MCQAHLKLLTYFHVFTLSTKSLKIVVVGTLHSKHLSGIHSATHKNIGQWMVHITSYKCKITSIGDESNSAYIQTVSQCLRSIHGYKSHWSMHTHEIYLEENIVKWWQLWCWSAPRRPDSIGNIRLSSILVFEMIGNCGFSSAKSVLNNSNKHYRGHLEVCYMRFKLQF